MKVYWKENTDIIIGEDSNGNKKYETEEKSGVVVGTAYSRSSCYPRILVAVEGGKFAIKYSYNCYHKEA